VTGGSAGIGLAIATVLAEDGYDLMIVGRDAERLERAKQQLDPFGHETVPLVADVAESGAERVVAAHLSEFGSLDVLVANAGTSRGATVADTEPHTLHHLLTVNVEANFAIVRAALPALRRDGDSQSWIILTASLAARWPVAGFAAYSATKAAIVSLAQSINVEESSSGIRACALCPGYVATAFTAPLRSTVAPESMIPASDVAAAVRFVVGLSPNTVVDTLTLGRLGAAPCAP
jgi:NADP-dependent 3-hydroxy acid dehydrogenase YdfG